jgi:hypothetical protein
MSVGVAGLMVAAVCAAVAGTSKNRQDKAVGSTALEAPEHRLKVSWAAGRDPGNES